MTVETHLCRPCSYPAKFNKTRDHCITKEDSAEKEATEFCPDLHYPAPVDGDLLTYKRTKLNPSTICLSVGMSNWTDDARIPCKCNSENMFEHGGYVNSVIVLERNNEEFSRTRKVNHLCQTRGINIARQLRNHVYGKSFVPSISDAHALYLRTCCVVVNATDFPNLLLSNGTASVSLHINGSKKGSLNFIIMEIEVERKYKLRQSKYVKCKQLP
jgi:hypothetical protein